MIYSAHPLMLKSPPIADRKAIFYDVVYNIFPDEKLVNLSYKTWSKQWGVIKFVENMIENNGW